MIDEKRISSNTSSLYYFHLQFFLLIWYKQVASVLYCPNIDFSSSEVIAKAKAMNALLFMEDCIKFIRCQYMWQDEKFLCHGKPWTVQLHWNIYWLYPKMILKRRNLWFCDLIIFPTNQSHGIWCKMQWV